MGHKNLSCLPSFKVPNAHLFLFASSLAAMTFIRSRGVASPFSLSAVSAMCEPLLAVGGILLGVSAVCARGQSRFKHHDGGLAGVA